MEKPTPKQVAGTSAAVAASAMIALGALQIDEGFKTKAYLDSANIATICYGHTAGVKLGDTKTSEQCTAMLKSDYSEHAYHVLTCAPNLANDVNALAGWTRFDFNTGKFCSTTSASMKKARSLIAQGRIKDSCPLMGAFVYAGGKKMQGLVNRRQREIAMCER